MSVLDVFHREFRKIVRGVDWANVEGCLPDLDDLLRNASRAEVLRALVDDLRSRPELKDSCVHFNLFSKLLLLVDQESGCKLRLHIFSEPVAEAHFHRASFAARILHGGYLHSLYGGGEAEDGISQGRIPRPLLSQVQQPGSSYVIDHRMVHSTLALRETVSVMVQGPTARESFQVINLQNGQVRTRSNSGEAALPQEPGERALTAPEIEGLVEKLTGYGLLAGASTARHANDDED